MLPTWISMYLFFLSNLGLSFYIFWPINHCNVLTHSTNYCMGLGGSTSNTDAIGKRAIVRRHEQNARLTCLQSVVPIANSFTLSFLSIANNFQVASFCKYYSNSITMSILSSLNCRDSLLCLLYLMLSVTVRSFAVLEPQKHSSTWNQWIKLQLIEFEAFVHNEAMGHELN